MKKLLILLCLAPLAAMANPTEHEGKQCDGHHHQMKHKKAGDVPFYMRDLDLSDTQKAQIKAMMEKRHSDRKESKTDYWENKKAIHELTKAETLNEAELEKLVDQSLTMKKTAEMERARFHHEMYQLLTPEQQQQLDAKMAEFKKKHHH